MGAAPNTPRAVVDPIKRNRQIKITFILYFYFYYVIVLLLS